MQAGSLLVGKHIFAVVTFLLVSAASPPIAAADVSKSAPAETFLAERLVSRLFNDAAVKGQFQEVFRAESHRTNPTIVQSASGGNCIAALSVEIASRDVVRKWDGSPDPNALRAASLFVDLRSVEQDRTRFYYDAGRLHVAIFFKSPLERSSRIDWEQRFLATKFQYGVSNEWQPSRLGNEHFQEIVATRLFMSLFGVYQQLPSEDSQIDATWFPITEQQRDLAVQSLKAVFAKCHP
jgi:hypothetical protein